jgi:hypothetical protein
MRSMVFVSLVLAALVLVGCPAEEPPQSSDAGWDTLVDAADADDASGPRLEVEITKPEGTFEVADSALEIVAGPQGGFHVELALRLEEPPEDSFITLVSWKMTHPDTGDVLSAQPSSLRVDHRDWESGSDGDLVWPRYWLVLDILSVDDVEGETVEIEVDVEVEGGLGHGADSVEFELVDEYDERTG